MRGPTISIIFRGCKIAASLTEFGLKFYPDVCQFLSDPSVHKQIDNINCGSFEFDVADTNSKTFTVLRGFDKVTATFS